MKLILASQSEWRKKLVQLLEIPFEVMESGVDENIFPWEEPSEVVATLATMKAEKVARQITDNGLLILEERQVIIGADTVVATEGKIIGKPVNREDAERIIGQLAGKTHEVWTGICVVDPVIGERVVEVEKTEVTFRPINGKQLEKYLDTKEWEGKAGGYQVQGAIKPYIKDIVGSYTNVIGLPMVTLVEMLERVGVGVEVDIDQILSGLFGRNT